MPVHAPSLCVCGRVVPSGATCPCRAVAARERKARFDRKRPNSTQRGYGGAWEKARKGFLAKHPFCRSCGRFASVVDHIIPHRGDRRLFWDRNNWQPLCTPCHSGAKQRLERRAHHEDP